MEFTLKGLAEAANARVIGDPDIVIDSVASVEDVKPGDITLAVNKKNYRLAMDKGAKAIIVGEDMDIEAGGTTSHLISKNPKLTFSGILKLFDPGCAMPSDISEKAVISSAAHIGKNVRIGPNVHIGTGTRIADETVIYPGTYIGAEVSIGKKCMLYPNVVIMDRCVLGNNVTIHGGSVIGADGFGYIYSDGKHNKIPQIGSVYIGDDVEIGANSCIDRATVGVTHIGKGTKIDNEVQVGHNVFIDEHVILVGHCGIGGSSKIGKRAIIAGHGAVSDHSIIGEGSVVMAVSIAAGNVPEGSQVSGVPARDHRQELRIKAATRRVPDLIKEVRDLKSRIEELESKK